MPFLLKPNAQHQKNNRNWLGKRVKEIAASFYPARARLRLLTIFESRNALKPTPNTKKINRNWLGERVKEIAASDTPPPAPPPPGRGADTALLSLRFICLRLLTCDLLPSPEGEGAGVG